MMTQHDTTRHDTTRHDTTRHDTTRHDTTRHDTTRHNMVRTVQHATMHQRVYTLTLPVRSPGQVTSGKHNSPEVAEGKIGAVR